MSCKVRRGQGRFFFALARSSSQRGEGGSARMPATTARAIGSGTAQMYRQRAAASVTIRSATAAESSSILASAAAARSSASAATSSAAAMAASAGRARGSLMSRWRDERCVATARTASLQSKRLRYSAMYCQEIRAHLRCLKIGDTGSSLSVPSRKG